MTKQFSNSPGPHQEPGKTEITTAPHNPQKAWRERNPLAYWAHSATRSAIRRGLITPQPCEICGKPAEAHHPDHANPLRVQWLCRLHHKRLHAQLRKGGKA